MLRIPRGKFKGLLHTPYKIVELLFFLLPIRLKLKPHVIIVLEFIKPKQVFGLIKRNCVPIKNSEPKRTTILEAH